MGRKSNTRERKKRGLGKRDSNENDNSSHMGRIEAAEHTRNEKDSSQMQMMGSRKVNELLVSGDAKIHELLIPKKNKETVRSKDLFNMIKETDLKFQDERKKQMGRMNEEMVRSKIARFNKMISEFRASYPDIFRIVTSFDRSYAAEESIKAIIYALDGLEKGRYRDEEEAGSAFKMQILPLHMQEKDRERVLREKEIEKRRLKGEDVSKEEMELAKRSENTIAETKQMEKLLEQSVLRYDLVHENLDGMFVSQEHRLDPEFEKRQAQKSLGGKRKLNGPNKRLGTRKELLEKIHGPDQTRTMLSSSSSGAAFDNKKKEKVEEDGEKQEERVPTPTEEEAAVDLEKRYLFLERGHTFTYKKIKGLIPDHAGYGLRDIKPTFLRTRYPGDPPGTHRPLLYPTPREDNMAPNIGKFVDMIRKKMNDHQFKGKKHVKKDGDFHARRRIVAPKEY